MVHILKFGDYSVILQNYFNVIFGTSQSRFSYNENGGKNAKIKISLEVSNFHVSIPGTTSVPNEGCNLFQ
jgi:hypothetical protein